MNATSRNVEQTLLNSGVEGADELHVEIEGPIVRLIGHLEHWDEVIEVGHLVAAQPGCKYLICEIEAKDQQPSAPPKPAQKPVGALPKSADVVVIGGGIIGMSIARELTKHQSRVLVLESGDSIGGATTSWNNGQVHSGHDPAPETLKAKLNVRGNHLWRTVAADLGIKLSNTGSFKVAFDDAEYQDVKLAFKRAKENGVPGAELLDKQRALEIEPHLNPEIIAALWTPSAAYIDPVGAAKAMSEDVLEYGGNIALRAPVTEVATENGRIIGVSTPTFQVETPAVVNAAGVHADTVAAMAGCQRYSIHPRKGTILKFGVEQSQMFQRSVGLPSKSYTKGGGVGPAIAGPTAVEQADRYTAVPTSEEIESILEKVAILMPEFPVNSVTEIGAGLRAATYSEDFVIEPDFDMAGFFHVAGTQSPGVASAPAIAELVANQLRDAHFISAPSQSFVPRAERIRSRVHSPR